MTATTIFLSTLQFRNDVVVLLRGRIVLSQENAIQTHFNLRPPIMDPDTLFNHATLSSSSPPPLSLHRRLRRRSREKPSSLTASASSKLLLSKVSETTEMNVLAKQLVLSDHHHHRLSFEPTGASGVGKSPAVSSSRSMQCCRFTVEEMEAVTSGFAEENVIGSGDNGVVYRGVLLDVNARVAVKKLLSNRSGGFWQVRHKNLVKLLGYCVEGYNRLLVYEYIDNGNLHQWLHGGVGQTRPLTWSTRLKIIQGIAKGPEWSRSTYRQLSETGVVIHMTFDAFIEMFEISHNNSFYKGLKRIVLISLRCVDPDVEHRPKMEEVIHMLEPRDLLLNDDHPIKRENSYKKLSKEESNCFQPEQISLQYTGWQE
ncbi:hypothetical protein JRO89_XS11G0208600 [Xanthoceras sorbifolium]|uniref:non-specific serine/threonine protein kinase n=1 Tax=Xanthoceras sorbifolium TaxID=99658 RepID=A0ABQ8HGH2_9ROSI|nr:hypothetical protein JRO89_XS11G0208600 [Xanthoceras sorbifolium]